MPWFKVDDNLAFHAKVVAAGNAAMGMWVRAGSWSAQQLTDGFVPDHMVPALGDKRQAQRLVAVGLWTQESDGYRFHEWMDRQPSREQVEAERAAARERMAARRKNKRGSSPEVRPNSDGTSEGVREPRPDPTRPDQVPTELPVGGTPSRKRPGRRLPDDFKPSDAHRELAKNEGVDLDREFARFVDYWQGEGKPKADWDATLRNWIRRAADDGRGRPGAVVDRRVPNEPVEAPPDGLEDHELAAWYARRRA